MGEVGPDLDLGAEGNNRGPPWPSRVIERPSPVQNSSRNNADAPRPELAPAPRASLLRPGSPINHKFFSNGKLLAFASWRLGRASTSHISTSAPGVLRGGLEAWVCCGIASLQPLCSGSPYLAAYLHHIGISFSVFTEMSLISKSVQLKSTLSK